MILNHRDIQKTVAKQIAEYASLLIAYSGGVDSTVLLHALLEIKSRYRPDLKLKAIHVHHGISQYADDWLEHCQKQCEQWSVPLIIERVTLLCQQRNIEEQARDARYQAIKKHFSSNTALCTAQHLDDQYETFFLALKRGSGPTGLSAMPFISNFTEQNQLIRPLLEVSRQQIEEYANNYQLNWIEDDSNQDDRYDRNFLRLNVLPLLNKRWAHFNQMVARSASLCQQQQQLIDEILADEFLQLNQEGRFFVEPMFSFSEAKRNALLRMWFKWHQVNMPSLKQLALIWQTVALAKQDSNPKFILANKQIRRYQNHLYLLPLYQDLRSTILSWDLSAPLHLPDNLGQLTTSFGEGDLSCRRAKPNEKITVHFHTEGVFEIVGRKGSRALKKLWQEFNIVPWERTRAPLIFYNDQLITAVGVFVTQQGKGDEVMFKIEATEK